MEKSIMLINVYFGKLPLWFEMFLMSCRANKTINFLLIIDDRTNYKYPDNVKVVYSTIEEVGKLINKKLNIESNIVKPYKLCDFKPTYGVVFEEYIKQYDYWGNCDIDLVFGNIRTYISDDVLNAYTKILLRGHLTIYKNTEEVNNYYKLYYPKFNYKEILESRYNYAFDEWGGIYQILEYNHIKQYNKEFIADIVPNKKKLNISVGNNYTNQVFIWDNGKIYRKYIDKGQIKTDEFCYIHFQKRKFKKYLYNLNTTIVLISAEGFFDISNQEITKELIIQNSKDEKLYPLYFRVKQIYKKIITGAK